MSGAVPSSDVEIDLGRWTHRVLSRWYIVVACVLVAIIIALLGAGGGKKEWTARAIVNEGQPYTSTNSPIAASLGTNPSAAGTLLKQDVVVKRVAGKVGLRPGQLKAAISTQPVGQPNAKVNFTPLVAVIVSGPWKTKVADAANRLAQQFVFLVSPYQRARLTAVQTLVNQEASQLKVLATREKVAVASYQQILKGPGTTQNALATNLAIGLLNTIETRQSQLQSQHAEDVQTLAQVKKIEMPTTVTRAVATQTTAASKRAGLAVAIILGLIVGVLLAIASYAAWPVSPSATGAAKAVRKPLEKRRDVGARLGRRHDRDDLELGERIPVEHPLLQQARVIALHQLEAALEARLDPAVDVAQALGHAPAGVAQVPVDRPGIAILEPLDDHEQHGSPLDRPSR